MKKININYETVENVNEKKVFFWEQISHHLLTLKKDFYKT
jgi:hypothetical protein